MRNLGNTETNMIALYIVAWVLVGVIMGLVDLYSEAKGGQVNIPKDFKWFYPSCLLLGPVFLVILVIIGPYAWYKESDVKNPFSNHFKKKREEFFKKEDSK